MKTLVSTLFLFLMSFGLHAAQKVQIEVNSILGTYENEVANVEIKRDIGNPSFIKIVEKNIKVNKVGWPENEFRIELGSHTFVTKIGKEFHAILLATDVVPTIWPIQLVFSNDFKNLQVFRKLLPLGVSTIQDVKISKSGILESLSLKTDVNYSIGGNEDLIRAEK